MAERHLTKRCLMAHDPRTGSHTVDFLLYFHNNRTMEEQTAVAALAALAQGMRLRIFRALVGAGPQGMTPGALAAALGVPASTLSFHLKELMHADLVSQERDGRNLIYRPDLAQMTTLLSYLSAHCCLGVACEAVPAKNCSIC